MRAAPRASPRYWIPACAGMTPRMCHDRRHPVPRSPVEPRQHVNHGAIPLQGRRLHRRDHRRPDGSDLARGGHRPPAGRRQHPDRGARGRRGRRQRALGAVPPRRPQPGRDRGLHPAAGGAAGRGPAARPRAADPARTARQRAREEAARARARVGARRHAAVLGAGAAARRVLAPVRQHGPRRRGLGFAAGDPASPGRVPRAQPRPCARAWSAP